MRISLSLISWGCINREAVSTTDVRLYQPLTCWQHSRVRVCITTSAWCFELWRALCCAEFDSVIGDLYRLRIHCLCIIGNSLCYFQRLCAGISVNCEIDTENSIMGAGEVDSWELVVGSPLNSVASLCLRRVSRGASLVSGTRVWLGIVRVDFTICVLTSV